MHRNLNLPIQVYIADDHALFRMGLKVVFHDLKKTGIHFMGEAANGQELINAIQEQQPDVILMDVEMPVLNGIHATSLIKQRYTHVGIIGLSYSEQSSRVIAMIQAGADGYLLKDTSIDELICAIKTVHEGYSYFTPAVSIFLSAKIKKENDKYTNGKKKELTPRETQILQMICRGDSSKEIASSLYVSIRTIDSFREKIMKKAGAKNLLQLLRFALQEELIKE